MISQFERYGFLGEIRVYTFRNLFKNKVPLGADLFKELASLHQSGDVLEMGLGAKKIWIKEFKMSNTGHAEILFHMTDPSIPDNVMSDRTTGILRTASRTKTEDPAVSAHIVVDLDAKYDSSRNYPACIENIDHLPRSLMIRYFNTWMASRLTQKITRNGEKEEKTFQPRMEFIAPASQTIQDALDNGGVLKGVKWVEDEVIEQTFGDKSYPVVSRTDVGMTVKNRPTGKAAKKTLQAMVDKARGQKPKAIKVTIEDENDRAKTIGIDPAKNNVLSSIFIPQEHFENFKPPMALCEQHIRNDLIAKMKRALKP